jgi:CBS domain-containing protein
MGLKENLRSEPVSSLPLRKPVIVNPGTTVRAAIEQMRAKRLGCAIVVDEGGKPIGTFSEARLVDLLLSRPSALDEDCVDRHLDKDWAAVRETDPISSVLSAMQSKNLRFVCVTDEGGKAVALTGQKGLMEYVAEHFPQQVLVQRLGGRPATEKREGA